ncbi:MAG: M1 family metallopeptidase [Anaerolineales bacterium]|nr:M1 family metallopeptidase [Anaerolineales bacterium]
MKPIEQSFHFTRFSITFWGILILILVLPSCAQAPTPLPSTSTPLPATATTLPTETPTLTPSPAPTETHTVTPLPTETPLPQIGAHSIGDPYAPELGNTGYDVQHYNLQLTLDPAQVYVDGAATIEAIATLHNLVELSLDFSGFDIQTLTVDDLPATYTRDRGKFIIALPQPLVEGQIFTIFIDYQGVPIQTGSAFVPFVHHLGLQYLPGNLYAINEPDGAHYWFPCNDHPRDKASFTFEITVPTGLDAISHGTLVQEEAGEGVTTYVWDHPSPMATYLATIVVGDYESEETISPSGVPIHYYYFSDTRDTFQQATSITREALDWMSEQFGTYPFESFGYVTTRLIRASLETQTMVLLSENMLNEETVVHEMAHQWFGDWVSMASWADMWSNEGFAVYVSLMWQTRDNPSSLNIFMQNLEATVNREASLDPLGALSPQRLFGFDSYQRGALMIHNLRRTVGDEAFFAGLRLYFERFGGGTATREDFIFIMEEASGMDLESFFDEWLN